MQTKAENMVMILFDECHVFLIFQENNPLVKTIPVPSSFDNFSVASSVSRSTIKISRFSPIVRICRIIFGACLNILKNKIPIKFWAEKGGTV